MLPGIGLAVVLLTAAAPLRPSPEPPREAPTAAEQAFLDRIAPLFKKARGRIRLDRRESIVAWERARLFVHTHVTEGSVSETGDRITGRSEPFTYIARQRLHRQQVEIELRCQSSRLFRTDDARRNGLLFWYYVKTGELPHPDLIQPYGVALNAFDVPVPGSTRAEIALQLDTLLRIYARDGDWLRACDDVAVTATEYLEEMVRVRFDERGRMTEGSWRERWTLTRCGRPVVYRATYTADGHGEAQVEIGPEPQE